ncbi:hypothetical protein ACFFH4_24390 [Halalkalibacter alkalisediminis]|uniref:Uncharacterized protein n=1 Tax=Halalkalibacter alkalisediminis TaxID=935616 RepID=A0ABV6NP23_9BACI
MPLLLKPEGKSKKVELYLIYTVSKKWLKSKSYKAVAIGYRLIEAAFFGTWTNF